jgi:hypothetical protein
LDGTAVAQALSQRITRQAAGSAGPAKQKQIKPNKTKQNCLDLLGFIRPNQDFSRGYAESK